MIFLYCANIILNNQNVVYVYCLLPSLIRQDHTCVAPSVNITRTVCFFLHVLVASFFMFVHSSLSSKSVIKRDKSAIQYGGGKEDLFRTNDGALLLIMCPKNNEDNKCHYYQTMTIVDITCFDEVKAFN